MTELLTAGGINNVEMLGVGKGNGALEQYYNNNSANDAQMCQTRWGTAATDVMDVRATIAAGGHTGPWTYVVLQGWADAYGTLPYGPDVLQPNPNTCMSHDCSPAAKDGNLTCYETCKADFLKWLGLFILDINAVGAVPVLWAPQPPGLDIDADLPLMQETYAAAHSQYGIPLIFTPTAWESVKASHPADPNVQCGGNATAPDFLNLMYADCVHQDANGMALNAYIFFNVLTGGQNPGRLNLESILDRQSTTNFPESRWDPGIQSELAGAAVTAGATAMATFK